jgi:uncharacterized protein YceK
MTSRLVAVAFAVVLMASGCAVVRQTGSSGPTGVVKGDVLAGPTCPVVSDGSTGCEPVPVEGKVEFWQNGESKGEVTIRIDGTFSVNVPVGDYTVKVAPVGTNGFPVCKDTTVTVAAEGTHELHLDCDTGIR